VNDENARVDLTVEGLGTVATIDGDIALE